MANIVTRREYKIAMAASTDAGNRSMRKAGRAAWSEEDRQVAVDQFAALIPADAVVVG